VRLDQQPRHPKGPLLGRRGVLRRPLRRAILLELGGRSGHCGDHRVRGKASVAVLNSGRLRAALEEDPGAFEAIGQVQREPALVIGRPQRLGTALRQEVHQRRASSSERRNGHVKRGAAVPRGVSLVRRFGPLVDEKPGQFRHAVRPFIRRRRSRFVIIVAVVIFGGHRDVEGRAPLVVAFAGRLGPRFHQDPRVLVRPRRRRKEQRHPQLIVPLLQGRRGTSIDEEPQHGGRDLGMGRRHVQGEAARGVPRVDCIGPRLENKLDDGQLPRPLSLCGYRVVQRERPLLGRAAPLSDRLGARLHEQPDQFERGAAVPQGPVQRQPPVVVSLAERPRPLLDEESGGFDEGLLLLGWRQGRFPVIVVVVIVVVVVVDVVLVYDGDKVRARRQAVDREQRSTVRRAKGAGPAAVQEVDGFEGQACHVRRQVQRSNSVEAGHLRTDQVRPLLHNGSERGEGLPCQNRFEQG
jgi:hypothetical protein